MKLKEILDKTTAFFKDKKISTPRLDAELLIAHGLRLERIQLYLKYDQPITEGELVVLRELVRRRSQGEPVAYILGYRDFYKYRFAVNSSVLIPRPETEHIVEEVLAWAKNQEQSYALVDLGCGSGCIGLTLLKELPKAKLIAVDISENALVVAKENANQLGVADRVHFMCMDADNFEIVIKECGDFLGQNKIDVVVANPPYIAIQDPQVEENVKKYEPNLALFANDQGMGLLKSWSKKYSEFLQHPGLMLMEMGMSQGPTMKTHLEGLNKFNEIRIIKDLSGHDRVIRGEING